MRVTGETYTAARAALLASPPPERARHEQQRIVARWFDDGGRLRAIPARRKVRVAVLLEILRRFTPGEVLTEAEIGVRLREVHPDVAFLRRELVGCGYLSRSGGTYRVSTEAPARTAAERRELPVWEQVWLPEFLAGGASR